jgi:hypothetical protein
MKVQCDARVMDVIPFLIIFRLFVFIFRRLLLLFTLMQINHWDQAQYVARTRASRWLVV